MAYEFSIALLSWLQIALLFVSVFFAFLTLRGIRKRKHKKKIMKIKKIVFAWLTAAVAFLAMALLFNNINSIYLRYRPPSAGDVFFILSYISFAIAFAYFWFKTHRTHKLHAKEPIFMFGVACGVFIWLYYLFQQVLICGSAGTSLAVKFLNYFNPIAVSIVFLLTLVIHPRLQAKVIRTPLWYISNGIFTYFIAFMLYVYSFWNITMTFIPVLYAALFFMSSGYFLLGFVAAKKKYA
jgi:hypothetical protein